MASETFAWDGDSLSEVRITRVGRIVAGDILPQSGRRGREPADDDPTLPDRARRG